MTHTKRVLEALNNICEYYGNQILDLLPGNQKPFFWPAARIACGAHDLGKLYCIFQNQIRKKLNEAQIAVPEGLVNIPHNILSASFLDELTNSFPEEIVDCIYQSVALHHARGQEFIEVDSFWRLVKDAIKEDLAPRMGELKPIWDCFAVGQPSISGAFRRRLTDPIPAEYNAFYILLKGLLHRSDHSASAHIGSEVKPTGNRRIDTTNYLVNVKKLDRSEIWQQGLATESTDYNVILESSTGSGKTEFALYWLGESKAFYTLPIRTSVNAMFERLTKTLSEPIGLIHSDALSYLLNKSQDKEDLDTTFDQISLARQLSQPISVCTVDQLFTSVLRYPGFEKIYATMAYSRIIIDEIQSYEPHIVALILKCLQDITNLGGKFCIVTATLPRIYLDKLIEIIPSLRVLPKRHSPIRKHKLQILDDEITSDSVIEYICSVALKNSRILIVVNTVRQAQKLFEKLRTKLQDNPIEIQLLHRSFIYSERRRKENAIQYENERGIWICTQIVEVSLDVDFPVIFTELSSIDSSIQRWGRVYRRAKTDYLGNDPNVIICKKGSGTGTIYDEMLCQWSVEALEQFDGRLISQEQESQLVDYVFAKDTFTQSQYYEEFQKSWKLVSDLELKVESRNEAQSVFRNISNFDAIPEIIYNENEREILEHIASYARSVTDKSKRWLALDSIRNFMLPVPGYCWYSYKKRMIDEKLGIYVINRAYNKEIGLLNEPEQEKLF